MRDDNLDGRLLRAQNEYKSIHLKLINSAIELINDKQIDTKSINITLIAKNADCAVATGYNHFPNGMLDVYGSLIETVNEGIQHEIEVMIKNSVSTEEIITNLVRKTSENVIKYGEASRVSLFAIKDIVDIGSAKLGDPFLTLKFLCQELKSKYTNIDSDLFATQLYTQYLGLLFSWMRFQEDSIVFSIFTDQWLLDRSSELLEFNLNTLN